MLLKLRVFRASDDLPSCIKYADGHENILRSYGIDSVTSSNNKWFNSPDVIVIVVESPDGEKMYGGAKIYIAKEEQHHLPLEEAIGKLDPKIYSLVEEHAKYRTGEICGLWNDKEIAGRGVGYLLIRSGIAKAGVVIANQLQLKSLFTLASPWTVGIVQKIGFLIETSIGDKGTFPYPTADLIATVLILHDTENLKDAIEEERETILDLRKKPKQIRSEAGPKGQVEMEYDLIIPNLII